MQLSTHEEIAEVLKVSGISIFAGIEYNATMKQKDFGLVNVVHDDISGNAVFECCEYTPSVFRLKTISGTCTEEAEEALNKFLSNYVFSHIFGENNADAIELVEYEKVRML